MTTTAIKRFCVQCSTERGIFQCDGCAQVFCLQHTTNHRLDVVQQLEQVEYIRDLVQKILTHELTEPRHDVKALHDKLTKTIDDWQEESISKIQKMAERTRNELFQYTIGSVSNMKLKLEQLTNELQKARENNDFIETDLREWEDKLNQLKEELIKPPNVVVREDYTILISNLRVHLLAVNEVFERSSGGAEVRGKCEYISGQHTVSLKIEQLTGWILFGIISQSTPLQVHSYVSPSCYGWYNGSGFVYAAGFNIGGLGSDVIQNDIIHLVIDCDNRLIRLINERTNQTLELHVDFEKCPFPWNLHLNLNLAPTRIQIVS